MPQYVMIVIDMLNDFLNQWDPKRRQSLIQSINELVAGCRTSNVPIIWIRQEFDPSLNDAFLDMRKKQIAINIKGTPGCQIASDLDVQPGDVVVVKKRYSAFFGTNLDALLEQLEANTLILAGINTHACVRMAAIDAYQRDYEVVLAKDGVDSYDREHHDVSLRYMDGKIARILSNQDIIREFEAPPH